MGGARDQPVEFEVDPRGHLDVGQLVAHPLVRHPQQCDVLVRCSFRCEARQMNLEQRAHLVHFLEVQPDAVQEEAHRLSHRGGVDGGDTQAAARAHLDHPLGGERSHGLSHDCARNAELLSQLALGRQAITDAEALREDRLEHHVRDLVREARLALDLVEEIRVVRALALGAHGRIVIHRLRRSYVNMAFRKTIVAWWALLDTW